MLPPDNAKGLEKYAVETGLLGGAKALGARYLWTRPDLAMRAAGAVDGLADPVVGIELADLAVPLLDAAL